MIMQHCRSFAYGPMSGDKPHLEPSNLDNHPTYTNCFELDQSLRDMGYLAFCFKFEVNIEVIFLVQLLRSVSNTRGILGQGTCQLCCSVFIMGALTSA